MSPQERAAALTGVRALLGQLPVPEAAKGIVASALGLAVDALESGHPDPEAAIEAVREYNRVELLAAAGAALRARFPQ